MVINLTIRNRFQFLKNRDWKKPSIEFSKPELLVNYQKMYGILSYFQLSGKPASVNSVFSCSVIYRIPIILRFLGRVIVITHPCCYSQDHFWTKTQIRKSNYIISFTE